MAENYDHLQGEANDLSDHAEYTHTDANEVAAYRIKQSVQPTGGRKPGGITMAIEAVGLMPATIHAVGSELYDRYKNLK